MAQTVNLEARSTGRNDAIIYVRSKGQQVWTFVIVCLPFEPRGQRHQLQTREQIPPTQKE